MNIEDYFLFLLFVLLSCIELYKFFKRKQTFRLLVVIPLVIYAVVGTPLQYGIPFYIRTAIHSCGVVFIIYYMWLERKHEKDSI